MKRSLSFQCAVIFLVASSACAVAQQPRPESHLGNVTGGESKPARALIEKKCTTCHTKERIDAALSAGKDMKAIQRDMEKRGAVLNARDRDVLGIYWGRSQPLKKK